MKELFKDSLQKTLEEELVLETLGRRSSPQSLCWRHSGKAILEARAGDTGGGAVHGTCAGDIVEELSIVPVLEKL